MLLIWGRIVIDVMDHLAGSIDHMVRQRFYQSGGIMAPSSVAGAVYDIYRIERQGAFNENVGRS